MKDIAKMSFQELVDLLDGPYVRWKDADDVVHAVGQAMYSSEAFCGRTLHVRILFASGTPCPVDCLGCLAAAEVRGILP
jgi:hypothetical protein